MRFEERDLKSFAEPVSANLLKSGEAYFSVQYADEHMLIPIVETWIFAGRGLSAEDGENRLYFQDIESYLQGIRYGSRNSKNATFQVVLKENAKHIFDYEHALEELMKCSLRRRRGQ
jgi:hypothetical protein